MKANEFVTIDGEMVPIEDEKNLLAIIRKAGIDIPTFCYHSELSVYGACRLCIVDVEGMGIVTSCSTAPRPGMVVRTNTEEVRDLRRLNLELLLADHSQNCTTCAKSKTCRLQELTRRFNVTEVRFKPTRETLPLDKSGASLVRDPNRCILCGDCVRMCKEVQGIGAIDFIGRGANVTVGPAFNKGLAEVECVNCGQCARVCPTGAITPRSEVDAVWKAVHNKAKTVVVQIAPAVRVALGECFGLEAGEITMGKMVAALRAIGFDRVYDTSFTADLTVIEEANEFLKRRESGENLPQFTSCCPAWVQFAEQYYPSLLPNMSSCRSPQQMFGALAKDMLPAQLDTKVEDLVVVSIMPCTAKKTEARMPKFERNGMPDVDYVLTTQELGRMIEDRGLDFHALEASELDTPFGAASGAGVLFGASGGVSEAVLRYVAKEVGVGEDGELTFEEVRGGDGVREVAVSIGDVSLKLAVVQGLANAKRVADLVRAGEMDCDFIEVMACPGGCIGGAGQPVTMDGEASKKRTEGLYKADRDLPIHTAQDNPYIADAYTNALEEVGSHKAHLLLHTAYQNRKRLAHDEMKVLKGDHFDRLQVTVCVGTSCHLRGSQKILSSLIQYVSERGMEPHVEVKAAFCMERCDRGPNVRVGDEVLERCTLERAKEVLDRELDKIAAYYELTPKDKAGVTAGDFDRQVARGVVRFLEKGIEE